MNLTVTDSNGATNSIIKVVTVGYEPLKGDLNSDGILNSADAAIVLQMSVRGEYSGNADISGDGRVTSLDALMILQAMAGR